jgi:hypothetical protein
MSHLDLVTGVVEPLARIHEHACACRGMRLSTLLLRYSTPDLMEIEFTTRATINVNRRTPEEHSADPHPCEETIAALIDARSTSLELFTFRGDDLLTDNSRLLHRLKVLYCSRH